MKNKILVNSVLIVLATIVAACEASPNEEKAPELKPRLVVLTDIGPAEIEPDDNESAVRLMTYADRFEIEAICTSTGWNCDPYPEASAEYLFRVIDAYSEDVGNLMKRSGQTGFRALEEENGKQELGYWPSAEYIRSRAMMGSRRAGIGVIGEGNDSPGSDFLIKLADEDDPRPIWVTAWGGANTLSQAIWRVKQTRTPEELRRFVGKFRLYTITDQDMVWAMRMNRAYSSHQWLRDEFRDDLLFVWDESAWLNQNALGVQNWEKYASLVQGRGNRNPVVVVNGEGGVAPIYLKITAGEAVTLDASRSFDPDGDELSFFWWKQGENGLEILGDAPTLTIAPETLAAAHNPSVVCEVRDNGAFNLVAYRRIVFR